MWWVRGGDRGITVHSFFVVVERLDVTSIPWHHALRFLLLTLSRGSTLANNSCASSPGMDAPCREFVFEPNVSGEARWENRE